jgi:hypothetical protein
MTPQERERSIKRIVDELMAERAAAERREARRRRDVLLGELENELPNPPLSQRGFGVMDDE